MHAADLLSWLDPRLILEGAGPWALVVVCAIIFAETGLLIGFLFPGDTLLIFSGLLTHTADVFGVNIWLVSGAIGIAAFFGGELGYLIGRKAGPAVFERRESGIFSRRNVDRTNAFFTRYGGLTVILARFVPVVRTFAPVAAGVGQMKWTTYSLYNLIGAVLWGFGLTMCGYLIAYIPFVRDVVTTYIDLILLAAVAVTVLGVLWHALAEKRKSPAEPPAAPANDAEAPAQQ